jgi:glycosyltransferase involved in cell wall biosynthesis
MKICFVGHSFHRRTGSSRFAVALLRQIGEVIEFYGDPDGPPEINDAIVRQLAGSRFDRYVFWQSELIAERLLPLNLGISFVAPMYDTVAYRRDTYWQQFVRHRFLSFTRAHHERLQAIGCTSSYFQYFPDPGMAPQRTAEGLRTAFFWQRQPSSMINYSAVLQQCRQLGVTRLHVHDVPDFAADQTAPIRPGMQAPAGVEVSVSDWFADPGDYAAVAAQPLFFFAPRPREGIGMAVLEAMARGQIVIAPDLAATNEYVAHGVSGLLYDPEERSAPTLPLLPDDALAQMSRAARRKAVEGHRVWQRDTERLLSLVAGDGRRWSTSDASAGFGDAIRRAAHARSAQDG